ncbi:MAG: rhodanese-like protein [Proteobacteria bacterium]|nr:rhodanese-like protein [Pseudomonadota bacterium]
MNDPQQSAARRRTEVHTALEGIRQLITSGEPSRATLDLVCQRLRTLAAQAGLWQSAHFPIPAGQRWQAYELNEDADGRFGLYAVAMLPGHAQAPHDHTTWAVIAGVRGQEENTFYRRLDDASQPGIARLEIRERVLIGAGDSIALHPEDIHAIEVTGTEPALHLHLYGRGLPHLSERRWFDATTGTFSKLPVFSGFPRV